MNEAAFQGAVIELAKLRGWRWHHETDSRKSGRGLPDLILVRPPRLIFAELKTQKGRLRIEQAQWLSALRSCHGVEVYLWRPDDLPEISRLLAQPARHNDPPPIQ